LYHFMGHAWFSDEILFEILRNAGEE